MNHGHCGAVECSLWPLSVCAPATRFEDTERVGHGGGISVSSTTGPVAAGSPSPGSAVISTPG